jgi:membrane-bound serine protease (ClpP class)
MKPYICLPVLAILLCVCTPQRAVSEPPAESSNGLVYVIPIKGMIERGLVYVIRRGVTEAVAKNADAIIFEMDTPGGRLDAAEEIVNIIASVKTETFTFVEAEAISAGAIIAMATDQIYMSPGSRIGDAMPIMVSPFGTPQEMDEGLKEKSVSYVSALIRSTAQRKNHDPQLAEAMVRREIEYRIGDNVICPTNQLLTMTNVEAEQIVNRDGKDAPLLSMGTVADRDELLEKIGRTGSETKEFLVSPAEDIARYIEMFSAFLLIGGLLGIYVEFKTPGFGFPGITGIILLAIWFWGHHVAGLAGMGESLLFIVGAALLLVEIFVIPGFGVTGIAGITLMMTALLMAMVQHYPGLPWYQPPVIHMQKAITVLGSSLLTTLVLVLILARFLPETPLFRRMALASALTSESGFQASGKTDDLVGLKGVAGSPLHPAGIGLFGDKRLDVVARGDFIDKDAPIVVAETHGNRIVVETV